MRAVPDATEKRECFFCDNLDRLIRLMSELRDTERPTESYQHPVTLRYCPSCGKELQ